MSGVDNTKHSDMQRKSLFEKVGFYADRIAGCVALAGFSLGVPASAIGYFLLGFSVDELIRILDVFTIPLLVFSSIALISKGIKK